MSRYICFSVTRGFARDFAHAALSFADAFERTLPPHRDEYLENSGAYGISYEGHTLGCVVLPHGARPLWMAGDAVWVLARDELDVEVLLRYRVTWP